ncbi:SDR family NAD(P)-dependent oxidoreductase [Hoeflea alexandrii]|uniref:SDR family NAD(P)-dependent oxidoreductase n=1 Tax=Hoeflea alexandrii TaxID=288436 RepID=UPI0022AF45C8|nr:SDR family NAD(P)-dependent oxidoreductase [Hoeflea alexandrii]MCZ4291233.1 SDR family NAD(P)-dependent oxidoreductase [Hoeflea alexandrii]
MELGNRTAIVTGAGRGLGRSHALALARLGARVVVNDMSAENATSVAQEIEVVGGKALAFGGSVTDPARMGEMVAAATKVFGSVDILVNNAGILRDKTFAKMDLDDFRLVVETHLMGSVICTKAVWDIMRDQGYGRIVMTTSSSGLYGNFGQSNYSAAKMALVGLMQTLAIEGRKYDIRVNCLAPTAATQMTEGVLSPDAMRDLSPDFVSEGLLALVGADAPTRAILCAGAGHFARANITLTKGIHIGSGEGAAHRVVDAWERIGDRTGETVPENCFAQSEQELAGAGENAPAAGAKP